MNIATKNQFMELNKKLKMKGCTITARYNFFKHFYYCLVNDRKLLLKTCTSSHISGSDLWQKISEIFMYTGLDPKERMIGAPETSYYSIFRNMQLIPIVFDAETRSLVISLAQKHYEVAEGKLNSPYSDFSKKLVMGSNLQNNRRL